MWKVLMIAVLSIGLVPGCGDDAEQVSRNPLDAAEVERVAAEFEAAAAAQVEAWNSGDVAAIRQVYAEDVEHRDGQLNLVGLDSITGMAERMFSRYPDWSGRLAGVYVGSDAALDVWEVGNIAEFTEDDPLVEYDLLELRDGRIASWTLYYHPETMPAFTRAPGRPEAEAALLAGYGTAWSSDDTAAVADLYAADTTRTDSLYGDVAEGRDGVERMATEWFDWFPNLGMELIQPIAEASHDEPAVGGIFAVRPDGDDGSCEVRMAVLLETSDAEQIVSERVYYDADSLIDCGWAE